MVAKELRMIMAKLGIKNLNDMIGRVDLLELDNAINHWKKDGIDLSNLLTPAEKVFKNTDVFKTQDQNHNLEKSLDLKILKKIKPSILSREKYNKSENWEHKQSLCTIISNEISKIWENKGLPEDTIHMKLDGSAGQSLGAWTCKA